MQKRLYLLLCLVTAMVLFSGCAGKPSPSGQNDTFDRDKISRETIEGNSRFAFTIFQQLNKEEGDRSIFISPLSISTTLAMTYQGA